MPLNAGTVTASAELNTRGFVSSLKSMKKKGIKNIGDMEQEFKSLGRSMKRSGLIMTAAVTTPIVAGFHKMTNEAALLEGAMAKFNVVFGDASDEMGEWVKEFRKEVPLATKDIIKSAAAMQDLLVPMGIAREEATEMSKDWLTLASRLAAFNDVPVDQALEAIRSGVAGMSRPLRQFGIDARESAVQQEALSMGLIKAGEEMDEQARQQALLSLAYKQSQDAIAGYGEQQDSLLLIQQELKASINDLATSLGKELMPIAKDLTKSLISLVKGMDNMDEGAKKVSLAIGGITAVIGPLLTALGFMVGQIGNLIPLFVKLRKAVVALFTVLKANPIVAVGAAIVGLGIQSVKTAKNINSLNDSIEKVLNTSASGRSLEQVTQQIVEIEETIQRLRRTAANTRTGVLSPSDQKQLTQLENKLDNLIDIRDELARKELINQASKQQIADSQKLITFINTDFSELAGITNKLNIAKPFIDAKKPMDDILGADLPTADELERQFGGMDLGERILPPGSLGALQERLQTLREEMRFAFTPERIEELQSKIGLTEEQIDKLKGSVKEGGDVWQGFAETLGSGLEKAIIHGKELNDILKNLAKQLASKALITGLKFLLPGGPAVGGASFFGNLFGGTFHNGGMVPGVGDKQITAKGGEMVLTKSQQKALGGMISQPSGASISESSMQRAFEKAMSKYIHRADDKMIFEMSQRGRRSF
jgi:uncharacterized protein Yka (UPF0111/DUF47 family)